jgi:hypothetical protein
MAEEARRRQGQARRAAGERRPVGEDEMQDERSGDGGDREIESLDPQGRQAHDEADQHGGKSAPGQVDQRRQAEAPGQHRRRVGAHAHECGMSEADLPGVARQHVQAGGGDDVDADQAGEELPVLPGHEREGDEAHAEDAHPEPLRAAVEERFVLLVGPGCGADAHGCLS